MYMLQEIDILEDWTAIKKVGLVLRAPATLTQGRGWQCSARRDTCFGLCRLSTWAFKGLRSSLLSPRCPLPSAQVSWHCCQLTSFLLTRAALEEGTSSLCQPLSCSRAGVDGVGEREGGKVGKQLGWLSLRQEATSELWKESCAPHPLLVQHQPSTSPQSG